MPYKLPKFSVRNIKLTLEYDGTNYAGWQVQTNAKAIQDVVCEAIAKMTEESVKLIGASRTDAGVHALGQVACFQTLRAIPCEGFLKGLNSLLPADIRVKGCEEVAKDFHPIRDAKRKTYRYLFDTGDVPSALERNRAWWVGPGLDWQAMGKAARYLIGEDDFRSFQAADSDAKTTVRTIETVDIYPTLPLPLQRGGVGGGVAMNFTGNGFLKQMVRNIVGTLVEVGRGRFKASEVKKILAAKDRTQAGLTAPPQGLYLVGVEY